MKKESARRGSLRRAVANRSLRRLLVALAVSWFGDWLYSVALAVFVYDATGSTGWVAAATIARMMPYLLLSPYGGVLADRFPKVRVLVISELASAAFMAGLTVVSVLDGPVLLAVVLATATATMGTPRGPAILAMLPQVVDEDELPAANALTSVSENVATVAGPAVCVALLVVIGASGAFAVNTLTFVFSAALISRLHADSSPALRSGESPGTLDRLRQGLIAAVGSAPSRACLGFTVVAYAVYGADSVLFVVLATERLDLGTAGIGYLFAALGLGGLLVLPMINRLASSARSMRALTATTAAYCLPAAVLALVDKVEIAIVLIVLRGSAFVVLDVVTVTAMQRLVPAMVLGRVFAVYASLAVGAFMLGTAIVTPTIVLVGLDGALLLFGLLPPAIVLLTYPQLRRLDERTSSRRDELEAALAGFQPVNMLAAATRPALERLAAAASLEKNAAGSVVVREGAEADAFYVVVDGRLAVTSSGGPDGLPAELGDLGPGDCFGEIGLVHRRPRSATVTARSDCVLYRVPGGDFLAALSVSPAAARSVLGVASARLARTSVTATPLDSATPVHDDPPTRENRDVP